MPTPSNPAEPAEPGETAKRADLLTVEQAAAFLHLSASSIRLYIREGTLKAFRVAGLRKVLIPRQELLALLQPTVPTTLPTPLPTAGAAES